MGFDFLLWYYLAAAKVAARFRRWCRRTLGLVVVLAGIVRYVIRSR